MIEFLAVLIIMLVTLILFTLYLRCSLIMCTSDVSMKGKVAIVTGANSGIGFYTAAALAARGARVLLACRSEARAAAARDAILVRTPGAEVECRRLDLASLQSVREFAAHVLATEPRLHVLVNNAGVYGDNDRTLDGIIATTQVNYFAHFLLTLLQLPLLKKSRPSRIVNLSSILHFAGGFNPATINERRPLESFFNYCNSKFCMLMFTVELSRRLVGTGVIANAVHPGVIQTDIVKKDAEVSRILFRLWCFGYKRTAEQGAKTVEHVAVAEEYANVSGKYFVDCKSRFMLWTTKNKHVARQLWEYSENLVKYKIDIDTVTKI